MKKFLKQYKWPGLTKEIRMNINFTEFKKINNLPKTGEKIVVAMSGGVDSSVTAAILNHLGYEVIGVSMKLYEASKASASKTCCSGKDIRDARTVAKKIGIKHFIVDYKSRFKQSVIEDFIESYNKGHTPIPCIKCNQTVKFKDMLDFSKSIGCSYLATGHYVKRIEEDGRIHLYQANDKTKDQSYFLFATTQNQLKTLRFPLGYFTKQEIRNLAKFFSLDVADKPDSQDICFIPDGNYRDFLKKHSTSSFKQGVIETVDGTSLGFHNGLANYTIGQRKGIGIGGIKGQNEHRPFYVVDINLKNNKVIVGPKDKLKKYFIYLKDLNFCSGDLPLKPFKATIKIRSGMSLVNGEVRISDINKNLGVVELSKPEYGVAPGQACVFYDRRKKMIGGGWISASEKQNN